MIKATNRTAAIAGVWSSVGLVASDPRIEHVKFGAMLTYNLTSLLVAAVFFFIPVFLFVIGFNTEPLSRAWFLDPGERAEYWIGAKRMIVWFVCAGVTGAVASAVIACVGKSA